MALTRLMIAGFAALASVVYASPCKPSSVTVVTTTSSTETATAASGSSSIGIHSFSSLSTTTSVETSITSESLSSFLSSYTTASSDSVSIDSSSFLSTDTSSSQPTSTLQATSSAKPTTTTEQPTTTTTDMTTSIEATTTISQCNSVDPLTTVALANPTPVFDDSLDHDDDFVPIVLPFGIGSSGSTTIYISSNGIVSLGSGADFFVNQELPTEDIPAVAYLPYWDDMYVSRTYKNTIVYEVFEGIFGTQATIEWVVGKGTNQMFHFDITFLQDNPNSVRFRYYTTLGKGSSATIGTQDRDNDKVIKIGYNTPDSVADGTAIILDTQSGTHVVQTFDNTECGKDADRNTDSESPVEDTVKDTLLFSSIG